MFKIQEFFKGKKTYIAGVLMIIAGFLTENSELIFEGLGIITLRAGIQKAIK